MKDIHAKFSEYVDRFLVDDGMRLNIDGVYVCYQRWSPFGEIVFRSLIEADADRRSGVVILDLEDVGAERQLESLGGLSHGYGEIFIRRNAIQGPIQNRMPLIRENPLLVLEEYESEHF